MKFFLLLFTFALLGWADDFTAQSKLDQANTLFKERADITKVATAVALLDQAETEATSTDLKYDVLVHESFMIYFQGVRQTDKAQKIALFLKGQEKADAARKLADYADAYYWSASNLGRWGEANGVFQSLGKKDEIMALVNAIPSKDTLSNENGETYEGFGSDRVLGRLYFKLPSFAGGSRPKSLQHLKRAYEKGGHYALNTVYYAETLGNGSSDEKGEAKRILDELLSNDPKTYNLDRIPETQDEFELARKLKSELGLN